MSISLTEKDTIEGSREIHQHQIQVEDMAKALLPAEADVEHGRVRSAKSFFSEFKHGRKLSGKASQGG